MSKSRYRKTKIGAQKLHPESQMMSYGFDPFMSEGSVKPPLFLTSTFAFKSAEDGADFFDVVAGRRKLSEDESAGLVYSRFNNPNLEILEDRLALFEQADACSVFSSGMAAISACFLAYLRPGDVILHSSPLYGGTETLIRKLLPEFGIKSADFYDGLSEEGINDAMQAAAELGTIKMVFIESPANPTNSMVDFRLIRSAVDAYEKLTGTRPVTVCDNTMLGPIYQSPLAEGIDMVIYSLTKYIGGHSDLVAGSVVGNSEMLGKIRMIRSAYGSQLDPHSAWMIGRSLETLVLRMDRAEASAKKVADWLSKSTYCPVNVLHPAHIKDARFQALLQCQTSGAGSTFSFVVDNRERAFKIINGLSLFKSAVSLGGTESLVCHPASTTHSGVSEDIRNLVGVSDGLIRISVGLEHPDDLIADLNEALKGACTD